MLMPKKYKWRKVQRGRIRGVSKGGVKLEFGNIGLVATSLGLVNSRQIEAARVSISRKIKREGDLFIRIFPHKPYTKRPAETRMGKGKGDVDHYDAVVKPGRIMFELMGVEEELAAEALKKAAFKLSVKTRVLRHSYF